MGHPTDWDSQRKLLEASLDDVKTSAVAITPAENWQASVLALSRKIPNQSILCGYSMGARLALGMALDFPESCSGLIFVSGNPGLESDIDRQERWAADQNIAKQVAVKPAQSFLENWYQQPVFATVPAPIRQSETERKLSNYSEMWPEILRTLSVSKQPNFWPRLNELTIPVLILAGQNDKKYKQIALRIGKENDSDHLSIEIVPESGHLPHREQPHLFSQIVSKFIRNMIS